MHYSGLTSLWPLGGPWLASLCFYACLPLGGSYGVTHHVIIRRLPANTIAEFQKETCLIKGLSENEVCAWYSSFVDDC